MAAAAASAGPLGRGGPRTANGALPRLESARERAGLQCRMSFTIEIQPGVEPARLKNLGR